MRQRPMLALSLLTAPLLGLIFLFSLMWATPTQAAEPPDTSGIPVNFNAHLTGAAEVPPVDSQGFGHAVFHLGRDGTTLRYMINVRHLTDITAAHIHEGAPGTNGPVVFTLYDGTGPFGHTAPLHGVLTMTVAQRDALLAGQYYVNIHTTTNPDGELRAQIGDYVAAPTAMHAFLKGENETTPISTTALGLARIDRQGYTLTYQVDVRDIMSITAAHIHVGAEGEDGPVVAPLYTGTGTFDPDNPLSGTLVLTDGALVEFMTGELYVNVHTSDNPGGEIRGQLGRMTLFHAPLSGDEEVPPVTTDASGRAVMALTADASALHYRVMVQEIMSVTAAHVHSGAMGINGPVVAPLYTGTGTFDADNPVSGVLSPTVDTLLEMAAGHTYVNVHTSANPSGEIRGQIAEFDPNHDLHSYLMGANEVPPAESNGRGWGRLHFYRHTGVLQYFLRLENLTNMTAAHIHRGRGGQNGPVVFTLYSDAMPVQAPQGGPDHLGGGWLLDAPQMVDLLTEHYYFNVHTTANPSGEIRGQIIPADQQVPTAVTLNGLASASTATLPGGAWALLGLTLLTGAGLAWRTRRR